ncbi:hypothetical protein P167DRAFT_607775 [Morchella conica CCBAS932]|uniref:Uncharacterized protein n=1 Tax=Morchella conica CCBAS932 TaxID=1392247 RepID=A0A3N4KGX5_9PEZI|nr:hypothetical protein P167DRAFT_607775 [Morchella conica CCBAS932]
MSYSDSEDEPSLESLTQNLAHQKYQSAALNDPEATKCCCGREDCSFTRRAQAMLASLEQDVQTAATLGQALLRRHESSMAEAQREREKMNQEIRSMEIKVNDLEDENARTTDENKFLLSNLEDVNISMCLSESRVQELQEELDAMHEELTRISATAARTEVLEAQLAVLESEQEELRNTVTTTRAEERAAVARWKKAQRTLEELEQQVERIEMENRMEKVRSKNLLERLDQKRIVDPKTGVSTLTALADRTQLSRFMKEILAENGHLQVGITELRDMLLASQEEVNRLREQLQEINMHKVEMGPSPLSQELGRSPSNTMQTIVHHHHYHPPPSTGGKGVSKPTVRRAKKRRSHASGEHFLPLDVNGASPPSTFSQRGSKRWSLGSRATTSSVLTSPASEFRESSIFDHNFNGPESSRPSSADSNYQAALIPGHKKQASSSSSKYARRSDSSFGIPPFSILHTTEEVPSDHDYSAPSSPIIPATKLRRAASHESMLSIMDLNLTTTSFAVSPAISSGNSETSQGKRTPSFAASVTPNPAQAFVTRGMVTRTPSTGNTSSAYSRLLGLQEGTIAGSSAPINPKAALSRKNSAKTSVGASWFWRWGGGGGAAVAPTPAMDAAQKDTVTAAANEAATTSASSDSGLTSSGGSVRIGGKTVVSKPSVLTGYVDEDLLRDSLGEVQQMLSM